MYLLTLFMCLILFPANGLFAEDEIVSHGQEIFKEEKVEFHGYVHTDFEFVENKKYVLELEHSVFSVRINPISNGYIFWELLQHVDEHIKLLQAYGTWRFNQYLNITLGKFLMPFGFNDKLYYCSLRWSNHLPDILSELIPEHWGEVGVKLNGNLNVSLFDLEYDFAMVNGLKGIYNHDIQTEDNNNNKMFGARFFMSPTDNFTLGVFFATGKYDDDEFYSIDFYGANFKCNYDEFYMRGGTIVNFVQALDGTFRRFGYFVECLYGFPDVIGLYYISPVFRYQSFDPQDMVFDNRDTYKLTAGLKIMLSEWFQILPEYHYIQEKTDPKIDNNGVYIGATFAY